MPTIDELKAAGYHGVQAHCARCRWTTQLFWSFIRVEDASQIDRLKARFKCSRCGSVPEPANVRPFYIDRANAIPHLEPPSER